jgi:hypothetical protein
LAATGIVKEFQTVWREVPASFNPKDEDFSKSEVTIGDFDLMNLMSQRYATPHRERYTYLEGIETSSNISRSHLDQLSEYSQICFQAFPFTDLSQPLDEKLRLGLFEPDDTSERS